MLSHQVPSQKKNNFRKAIVCPKSCKVDVSDASVKTVDYVKAAVS